MLLFILLFMPLHLQSIEFMKDYLDYKEERPLPTIANDFVYGEGTTELTSQINNYEAIKANKPIQGTIFVTHERKNNVDEKSFRIGNKPLKTSFVQTTQMSSLSDIVVTIYQFQLDGLPAGDHTLPSINVKVGGKEVQALPLFVEVSQ